jgi:hypothetical protein
MSKRQQHEMTGVDRHLGKLKHLPAACRARKTCLNDEGKRVRAAGSRAIEPTFSHRIIMYSRRLLLLQEKLAGVHPSIQPAGPLLQLLPLMVISLLWKTVFFEFFPKCRRPQLQFSCGNCRFRRRHKLRSSLISSSVHCKVDAIDDTDKPLLAAN